MLFQCFYDSETTAHFPPECASSISHKAQGAAHPLISVYRVEDAEIPPEAPEKLVGWVGVLVGFVVG